MFRVPGYLLLALAGLVLIAASILSILTVDAQTDDPLLSSVEALLAAQGYSLSPEMLATAQALLQQMPVEAVVATLVASEVNPVVQPPPVEPPPVEVPVQPTVEVAEPVIPPTMEVVQPPVEVPVQPTAEVVEPVIPPTVEVVQPPVEVPVQPTAEVVEPVILPTSEVVQVLPGDVSLQPAAEPDKSRRRGNRDFQPSHANALASQPMAAPVQPTAVPNGEMAQPQQPAAVPPQPTMALPEPTGLPDASITVQPTTQADALPAATLAPPMPVGRISGSALRAEAAGGGVELRLTRPDGTVLTLPTGLDGLFAFANMPPGTYMLEAAAAGFLSGRAAFTLAAGQDLVLPPLLLPAGDTNGDSLIDLTDAVLLAANFDAPPPVPGADLNGDGWIDVRDLVLLGNAFGLAGPLDWN